MKNSRFARFEDVQDQYTDVFDGLGKIGNKC